MGYRDIHISDGSAEDDSMQSDSLNNKDEGHIPPNNEEDMVEAFRNLLLLHGHLTSNHGDHNTLLRFLKMRDFDLEKSKDAFLDYMKWRLDSKVDLISKFKFEEYDEVKKHYPHGFHKVDKSGRPIYIERLGMADLNAFLKATTVDRYVNYHIKEQEKTLSLRYPACSIASEKHVSSTTTILDVSGVGMSNFSKPARSPFMEIQKIDSNYYPETLHRLFVVNASSGFRMLWLALKTFLDARTLAKVQVLGPNYLGELLEAIDLSNLPTFLGGNCTCSDHGGCLFSDERTWNDPDIKEKIQESSTIEDADSETQTTDKVSENASANQKENSGKIMITLEKYTALKTAVKDSQKKIEMLEVSLHETKKVLKGLAEIIKPNETEANLLPNTNRFRVRQIS
ncbi:PREDICTED: phosphatidylinositol/phosphatidylcholine transfer protein SFH11-like isoform X2 [Camelina sativa]|uniref:Phosphatidylinositol/phosphatidylcholine transfer protein SFH11-like isoform X2 n=1 Tax=Camelina sativa TaxID=90675 RepID=A0ABM1R8U5_CAMSA|nr:PREDICTED: phosphatidylinositol/phosphatidylcholine transfer protein SFH11-like isoform X2 [Camelina sativa]